MFASYPAAWLLLTLPFLSGCVIRSVPSLHSLAGRRNRRMRLIGTAGLAAMLLGLTGVVPPRFGLPMMVLGGVVSGFTMFTLPRRGGSDDDDGWRWWRPPSDDPPPPDGDGTLDWDEFDRIRTRWELQPPLTGGRQAVQPPRLGPPSRTKARSD